jgi:phosphatidylglycerophosphatase A
MRATPTLKKIQAMTAKTDTPAANADQTRTNKKPSFAIFLATAGGLGYFPKAPGTFGSIAGIALAMLPMWFSIFALTGTLAVQKSGETLPFEWPYPNIDPILLAQIVLTIAAALIGVWAASSAARYWGQKDPQRVVIDEVSGQHLTILLGCLMPVLWTSRHAAATPPTVPLAMLSLNTAAGWKYLLAGFILFRLFDIWKPFPARQAESLPGGWGIMADDWIAGIYAAICLWLARSAGL